MVYPVILTLVSIVVVSFLLVFVIPKFISMYANIELPLPTRMLMVMSDFLINNFSTIIIVLVALGILGLWMSINETVRYHFGRLQLKAPAIGTLLTVVMTSRFCSTFSVLLKSGIGIMKSLEITSKAMDSTFLECKLHEIMDNVRKGKQFSAALSDQKIFDKMMVAMVVAGEETGSLDELMSETGEFFEVQADEAATKLITFIEPVMIVIFGFIVAFIVLSIILPMFSMYQQMM
ncbi:MAG: type II secretion system F family protein, partial [Oscillospiraceae bacterium]